jgi:hypothetical protein
MAGMVELHCLFRLKSPTTPAPSAVRRGRAAGLELLVGSAVKLPTSRTRRNGVARAERPFATEVS